MVTVASFDIGSKNFAFVVERYDDKLFNNLKCDYRYKKDGTPTDEFKHILNQVYKNGQILNYVNMDLTKNIKPSKLKSYLDPDIFRNMITELDKHKPLFQDVDIVLIEQQMSFGTKVNVKALKIAQACFTYWLMRYPKVEVMEFKSFYKTQVLGAVKKLTKPQRKKFAVEEASIILNIREDYENLTELSCSKKKDDLADTLVQLQAFKILRYIDNKI